MDYMAKNHSKGEGAGGGCARSAKLKVNGKLKIGPLQHY
jgi:hypothetical protein